MGIILSIKRGDSEQSSGDSLDHSREKTDLRKTPIFLSLYVYEAKPRKVVAFLMGLWHICAGS